MRKRARRIVMGLGLAAAALACCLVVLDPDALALQAISWRARIRGDAVVWPRTISRGKFQGPIDISAGDIAVGEFLQAIADWRDRPVIIDADRRGCLDFDITIAADMVNVDAEIVRAILRTNGINVVEEPRGKVWSVQIQESALGLVDEPADGVLIRVPYGSR